MKEADKTEKEQLVYLTRKHRVDATTSTGGQTSKGIKPEGGGRIIENSSTKEGHTTKPAGKKVNLSKKNYVYIKKEKREKSTSHIR